MIVMIVYAVISFLLDGLVSNYMAMGIDNPSYLRTIFTVVSLVIMLSFFDEHQRYLYILCGLGFLFDIVYTGTFIFNVVLFLGIYFVLEQVNYFVPDNFLMVNIKALLAISLYYIFSYLILMLVNYSYYPLFLLGKILLHSIIGTIIYASLSYLVIKKIYFKIYDKKIK